MKLDSNNHSVFLLHYHLVLVVKYRREVFTDEIKVVRSFLNSKARKINNLTQLIWSTAILS